MSCEVVRRVSKATARVAVCLCLVSSLSGCGGGAADPPKTPRVNASGKVEFDGQPLPAGTLTFTHVDTGHNAICNIYDGEYESDSGNGPEPGNNLVFVKGQEEAEGTGMWQNPWKKDVVVGDSDFTEDFSIASNEVKPFDPSTVQEDEEKVW